MYRRLFIYFYFTLFFWIECLWSAKIMRIEGQLAFTKPHLFGQFIFHQEPVLDQTMTNLQQNTIGLKFLDFNRIKMLLKILIMTCLNSPNI